MVHPQDIQVFVFLTIPWWQNLWRHDEYYETKYIFEYIFWITTHEVTKLGQLIDINQSNNF